MSGMMYVLVLVENRLLLIEVIVWEYYREYALSTSSSLLLLPELIYCTPTVEQLPFITKTQYDARFALNTQSICNN